MTVEEALQILQGNPTEEEVFAALVALAEQDETTYVGALPRAVEILTGLGREVSREGIDASVREIQTQLTTPQSAVTLSGEVSAVPETSAPQPGAELAGGVGPAPSVPPEQQQPQQLGPEFIGVAPDFRAEREFVGMPGDIGQGAGATRQQVGVPPRYKWGDESGPAGWGPVRIRRYQKELEKAGLLEPGAYSPGFWDAASEQALAQGMDFANKRGVGVESVIEELKALPRNLREDKPRFQTPPELQLKVDPASVTQRVKQEFRSRLGREPTDEEMAEYAGYLSGQYEAGRQEGIALARATFDAANLEPTEPTGRAFQSDIGGRPVDDSAAGRESFTNVDPVARFQEAFDRRFGSEEQFIEDQENTFQASERIMQSLASLQSRVTQ